METHITRSSTEFRELQTKIQKAIQSVDTLIEKHRPSICDEVYLTSEEVCGIFGISIRSLQNYRDDRMIPYTTIGGKFLYPQSAIHKMLEKHFMPPLR